MDFDDLKEELNIRLDDTDGFTFTTEEKTSILTEAINDESVVKEVWNSSLTFNHGTYQYAKPSGVDVVTDIYIKRDNNLEEPEPIASSLWEVVGSNIHFKPGAQVIPDGYTLFVKGKTKYDVNDTIAEVNIQEYVLNLAQLNALNKLGLKRTLKFLKNDTTVSEIVTIKRELERKVAAYKARLPRSFEAA